MPQGSAQQFLAQAQALGAQGRVDEAQAVLQQAATQFPADARVPLTLASLFLATNRPRLALDAAGRAAALNPLDGRAAMMTGIALGMLGRDDEASDQLAHAAKKSPRLPEVHYNLGLALSRLRRFDAAAKALRKAVGLKPDNPDFASALGIALAESGDRVQAQKVWRKAMSAHPRHPLLGRNLAVCLLETGADAEALAVLERLGDARDRNPALMLLMAQVQSKLGKLPEAEASLLALLESHPEFAEAYNNLGSVRKADGRPREAIEAYRRAYEIKPRQPMLAYNLALCLKQVADYAAALGLYQEAAAVYSDGDEGPTPVDIAIDQSICLEKLGRDDEAEAALRSTLDLAPADERAHTALAKLMLRQRRFDEADPHLRLRDRDDGLPPLTQRLDPDAMAGRRIRVVLDQGVGDHILQVRIVERAFRAAARIELVCMPRLVGLLARSFPDWTVSAEATGDEADVVIAGTDLSTIPVDARNGLTAPFLIPDPARVAELRARLEGMAKGRRIVGLSWFSGNPTFQQAKSLRLRDLAPILTRDDVFAVNIQYGEHGEEIAAVETELGCRLYSDATVDPIGDLDGFAAQVAALDAVLTISGAAAHFAGAVNCKGVVMLDVAPIWHWGVVEPVSLYYPGLRLVRQAEPGNWTPVVAAAVERLLG